MAVEDASKGPARETAARRSEASTQEVSSLRPWSAFVFRDYRILWLSSVASMVTMQVRLLATSVWLYQETGSGLQLGLLGLVQLAAQIPATIYGGTLADDMDRKKLMAFTQASNFFLIALMAALVAAGNLLAWHVYAITAVLAVTNVLGGPARNAMTAAIVPKTHLMHAVTSNTATMQIGSVLAPLAFAGAARGLGITATFIIAAAFALPSTVLPLMIRVEGKVQGNTRNGPVLRRIWEGFLYVKSHPILPGLYIMDIGVTVFTFYRQVLPLLADRLFRAGADAVGMLTAANSAGGVAGSFLVLFLARYRPKGMMVLYATLAYGLLVVAFGFSNTLWLGMALIVAMGATDAIGMATRQTTAQLTTPQQMMGRALSFHSLSAMSANNLGTFVVGTMSDQIGAGQTMAVGGLISMVVVLLVWRLVRGIREYRYP